MRRCLLVALFGLAACVNKPLPLTDASFAKAQRACGAVDAYLMPLPGESPPGLGGTGIGFKGRSPDHARQLRCLGNRLHVRFARVGFISEPTEK